MHQRKILENPHGQLYYFQSTLFRSHSVTVPISINPFSFPFRSHSVPIQHPNNIYNIINYIYNLYSDHQYTYPLSMYKHNTSAITLSKVLYYDIIYNYIPLSNIFSQHETYYILASTSESSVSGPSNIV